jgi:hypothetical protein
MTLAAHVWGMPACGQPTQAVEAYPADVSTALDDGTIVGFPDMDGCRVVLTPYGTENGDPCTTIVHEWGHLAGQVHSDDPSSVMYESPDPYWRCIYGTNTNPLRTYQRGWNRLMDRRRFETPDAWIRVRKRGWPRRGLWLYGRGLRRAGAPVPQR